MASVSVDTGYIPGHPGRELQGLALELCDPAQIDRSDNRNGFTSFQLLLRFSSFLGIDQEKIGGRTAADVDGPERGEPTSGLAAETAPPTT